MTMPQSQGIRISSSSIPYLVGQPQVQQQHRHQAQQQRQPPNGSNGSAKSHSRRPSFSITLPPSRSRSSQLGGASTSGTLNHLAGANEDVESTAGFEEALQEELEPPIRRRSVQFIPGK
jgi:hypothetical protein